MTRALADLLDRIAALPPTRHGLPIVLSVGRLNELKGMARLAEAFAVDPGFGRERRWSSSVAISTIRPRPRPPSWPGSGRHRQRNRTSDLPSSCWATGPTATSLQLLAAVRHGVGRLIGPDGAYVSASRKEEFGLAIVEALAAGLPVVAPLAGGPATYVEDGRTGCLVDTADPAALMRGVAGALDLSGRPGRAEYAAETIAARYDISGMARP